MDHRLRACYDVKQLVLAISVDTTVPVVYGSCTTHPRVLYAVPLIFQLAISYIPSSNLLSRGY